MTAHFSTEKLAKRYLAIYPFCFASAVILIYVGIELSTHGHRFHIANAVCGFYGVFVLMRRVGLNTHTLEWSHECSFFVNLPFFVVSVISLVLSIYSCTRRNLYGLDKTLSILSILFSLLQYGFYLVHWQLMKQNPIPLPDQGACSDEPEQKKQNSVNVATSKYPINYYTGSPYSFTCGHRYGYHGPVHHHQHHSQGGDGNRGCCRGSCGYVHSGGDNSAGNTAGYGGSGGCDSGYGGDSGGDCGGGDSDG